ncbi:MAG: response regulator [Anaerolineae bacterium]|nr:response regulator [Anaerolineae bacterium]
MSTWMVVEDEPTLYETLLMLFEIWSIDGVAFTNGSDAIRWIDDVDAGKIETNIPELAMLDIRLPGASGDKVAQRLRQSPVLGDIVIVFMTAYYLQPEEEKELLESAETKHIIYKPLPGSSELQAMLRSAINGNAAG